MQPGGAGGLGEVTDDVAMRAHFYGGPIGEGAVAHGGTVVGLGDRDYVFCADSFERGGPVGGVPFFGAEFGDEIFVAEIFQGVVIFLEVFVGGISGAVHVVRTPFVDGAGDGVNAAGDVDSELGVFVSLGDFEVGERLLVRAISAVVRLALGICN